MGDVSYDSLMIDSFLENVRIRGREKENVEGNRKGGRNSRSRNQFDLNETSTENKYSEDPVNGYTFWFSNVQIFDGESGKEETYYNLTFIDEAEDKTIIPYSKSLPCNYSSMDIWRVSIEETNLPDPIQLKFKFDADLKDKRFVVEFDKNELKNASEYELNEDELENLSEVEKKQAIDEKKSIKKHVNLANIEFDISAKYVPEIFKIERGILKQDHSLVFYEINKEEEKNENKPSDGSISLEDIKSDIKLDQLQVIGPNVRQTFSFDKLINKDFKNYFRKLDRDYQTEKDRFERLDLFYKGLKGGV